MFNVKFAQNETIFDVKYVKSGLMIWIKTWKKRINVFKTAVSNLEKA